MTSNATTTEIHALIDRYWSAFEAHDLETWASCYAPDAQYEDVPTGFVGAPREFYGSFLDAVPDQSVKLHERIVGEDAFALAWTIRGHLTGDFGPIEGRGQAFELRGTSIAAVKDGLIVANRDYWDFAGLLAQLGVTELPA